MVYKSYKYRIYPTKKQFLQIERTFNCCRLVYNLALETKITAYQSNKTNLSAFDLINQLPDLKNHYIWLKEVDSQTLQASVKTIDKAYKNFFNGKGYPKFKKKSNTQSFNVSSLIKRIDWVNNTLTIPKIKDIPIVLDRQFNGKIKTITISKTATSKYFASILVEENLDLPQKLPITEKTTIGIDLGLKDFAIFDSGKTISNPKFLKNNLDRLKILQKRASKKKKGSNNRKKANLKVAKLHEKITNKRKNFLHNLSSKIVNNNQVNTICMEDLKITNMMKNHKLAQAISDVSWLEFTRQIRYKCEWKGKNFIQIGRFEPSSKTCSNCGFKKEELKLEERTFNCENCSFSIDRDLNAAINIKNFGLKQIEENIKNPRVRSSGESVELLTVVKTKKQKKS